MTYISNALDTYRFMSEKNIIMAFTGHIDQKVINSLLKNIKSKLNLEQVNAGTNKRVYSTLVESVENISKHSSNDHRAMLLLGKSSNAYTIVTGNQIPNKAIPDFKRKLEFVSSCNQTELKEMYREQMLSGWASENSAGLGILDIAIKSENNIKYDFKPLTDDKSFFLFEVQINIQ